MKIRPAHPDDRDALLDIWLRSVRATHAFLTEADIQSLLPSFRDVVLVKLELWVLASDGQPIGLLGMTKNHVNAMFIAPEHLRRGGGRMLVEHAQSRYETILADVNEQNSEARMFYEAVGFTVIGRSEVDGQGRPFPLQHLRRSRTPTALG